MPADRNSYGQIPTNLISACQLSGIYTDRFQQISFLYVSRQEFLRTDSNKYKICMSADWNSYGQMPANHNYVCQLTGILTDRSQQIIILYVNRQEFIRTDSNKSHFCMSAVRDLYGQIPTNLISVCQQTGIHTDRFQQVLIMYVSCP